MRILLLTQIVPYPPDSGPKIKTLNVLRYLAVRHELHLVSFARSASEQQHSASLRDVCASVTTVPIHRSRARDLAYLARSLVAGRPFLIERDDSTAMRRAIRDLLTRLRFDAVHADQLGMAQFAADLPVPLRVLDEHNAVWTIVRRSAARAGLGPTRIAAELEWRKLRAYEGSVSRRFDRITVVSEEDKRALEDAAGSPLSAEVIPIAVDTERLAFEPRTARSRHVVSVATMFYPPNVEGVLWFATEIFPLIRRQSPGTRFYVVGSRPPASVANLHDEERGIVVTGYVSDLGPLLQEAAVTIVPVHSGSGMRVKILEAFARGIPVVSTTVGAEGIEARSGEHLLVADEPAAFARAVLSLVQEPREAERLASSARRLVTEKYDWRTALTGLDRVYSTEPAPSCPASRLPSRPSIGVFEAEA